MIEDAYYVEFKAVAVCYKVLSLEPGNGFTEILLSKRRKHVKKSLLTAAALLAAVVLVGQGAQAKTLEDILKEKGVITEADYKEVTKSKPIDYKLGKGFTFTSADEKFQLSVGGLLMVRYAFIDKDGNTQDTSQFSLKKGRLWLQGYAYTKDLTYRLQLAFEQSGNEKMLEYATVSYKFMDEVQLLAGQNKLVYSRQNMASVGALQLVDVAPPVSSFSPGYDLGAYLYGNILGGIVNYDLSVSNGAGQTKTRTSNDNAFLAHLQVNPFGYVGWAEGDVACSQKPLVTLGGSYYRNTFNKTGGAGAFESTNVGLATTSGWLGSNVATFVNDTKVDVNSFNIDTAVKWMGASLQGEYFWGQGDGNLTDRKVRAQGYYVQAGYTILPKKLEVAMRYSYLDPNRDKANDTVSEVVGGVSYYFSGHNLKLQADVGNIHTQKGANRIDDMQYRAQVALVF